jgi:hypothetical protein
MQYMFHFSLAFWAGYLKNFVKPGAHKLIANVDRLCTFHTSSCFFLKMIEEQTMAFSHRSTSTSLKLMVSIEPKHLGHFMLVSFG